MSSSAYVSPAVATIIFSLGTGMLGGVASMILAKRIERTEGVNIGILILAVAMASALNIGFAVSIPYLEESELL